MARLPNISLLAILFTLCLQVSSQGTQFITGACAKDAACASGCCGFNSGKCAGPIIAQERDGGCGFSDPTPNDRAAQAFRGGAPNPPPPTVNPNTTAPVEIIPIANITAPIEVPNVNTTSPLAPPMEDAPVINITAPVYNTPIPNINTTSPLPAPPEETPIVNVTIPMETPTVNTTEPALMQEPPSKPAGTQFITGSCTSDAICASKCCGFTSGKCAGPIVAQERDGGCGFGDAVPNDDAARALVGKAKVRRGLLGRAFKGV